VILAAVQKGATLICSGWFETDDAELSAERLGPLMPLEKERRPLAMVETMPTLEGGAADVFRFAGTIPESCYATNSPGPTRVRVGAGAIVHHPLPIEWAEPSPALARFYRTALDSTPVRPLVEVLPPPKRQPFDSRGPGFIDGVTVVTVPFAENWLVVAMNESHRAARISLRRPGGASRVDLDVSGGRARLAFIDPHRWTILDAS
jgi:hypothetical protein